MKKIILLSLLLCFNIQSLFALSYEWGPEYHYTLEPDENLMTVRNPLIFSDDTIIEPGFKYSSEKEKEALLYFIFEVDEKNKLKLKDKININKQTNDQKEKLKKVYDKVNLSKSHTAYRGEPIPDSNSFVEAIFTWYDSNPDALYRISSLTDNNEITGAEFKNFSINQSGEIYNADFTITGNGYILSIVSVSPDFNTEEYTCYYNYGKIDNNKIAWKNSTFNKALSWAKHEILACTLKDSYILLCSDPASIYQKYSICKIRDDGMFVLGSTNSFDDFVVTNEPTYISDLDLIVFPGEYKKGDKWVQATATYSIDYENKKITNKIIQDIPEGKISEYPALDYLPESKKLLLTKYHDSHTFYYALADIKK